MARQSGACSDHEIWGLRESLTAGAMWMEVQASLNIIQFLG
jgi:hypothetical protein